MLLSQATYSAFRLFRQFPGSWTHNLLRCLHNALPLSHRNIWSIRSTEREVISGHTYQSSLMLMEADRRSHLAPAFWMFLSAVSAVDTGAPLSTDCPINTLPNKDKQESCEQVKLVQHRKCFKCTLSFYGIPWCSVNRKLTFSQYFYGNCYGLMCNIKCGIKHVSFLSSKWMANLVLVFRHYCFYLCHTGAYNYKKYFYYFL